MAKWEIDGYDEMGSYYYCPKCGYGIVVEEDYGDWTPKVIEAQAEAEANKILSESITPELIQMTEAEARKEHGWVTVQGADVVAVE